MGILLSKLAVIKHSLALILVLILGMGSVYAVDKHAINVPAPKGEECVEDAKWMRVNHFKTVLNHRDDTVIRGIRTEKHSLKNCIDCHITPNKTGDYARYSNSEEHFCASCHTTAAVSIDCFSCHADRPEHVIRAARQQSQLEALKKNSVHVSTTELILNTPQP